MLLGKLLAILSTAKGAAAASVIVAAAVGTGVAATNVDVQTAISATVRNLGQGADAKSSNRPAVVTARNDADKKLRDAFQEDQQKLAKLHSAQVDGTVRVKLTDTINTADTALRARLTLALNDIATLTLGREGLESPKPIGSPDIKVEFTADAKAKVEGMVNAAITDMNSIVVAAQATVTLLPTFAPGKDGAKPDDAGKPASAPTAPPHP